MNDLLIIDQQLFLFLNHLPHNTFLNSLGIGLSAIGAAGLIWLVLGAILFIREEKKDHLFFAPLFISGAICWVLVEKIIKPIVARPRPTLDMGAIILGHSKLNDFSFPSGHAAIAWTMAVLLSQKEPRWRWFFYGLATAISFSRIYLGVHYPLDVVSGGLVGWVLAKVVLIFVGSKKPEKKRD